MRKILGLFTARKLPGWALLAYAIFNGVPDYKARIDFWLERAREAPAALAMLGVIAGNPYFAPVLGVVAILYLFFVGEPKKQVRHQYLPYAAWGFFGVVSLALIVAITTGYVASALGPRYLTNSQKDTITKELNTHPSISGGNVNVSADGSCPDCGEFAHDMEASISGAVGWRPNNGTVLGPNFETISDTGVTFHVDPNGSNETDTKILEAAFDKAHVKYEERKIPSRPFVNPGAATILVSAKIRPRS